MPTPLPSPTEVNLVPPDPQETALTARGVATAAAPTTGLTDLQRVLFEALFPAMTGHPVDLSELEPMSPAELAEVLRRRDLQFRTRGVQLMLLGALVLRPLPPEVADRIAEHDPALASRWTALEDLPAGTLGRHVWELYRARGARLGAAAARPARLGARARRLRHHRRV